MFINDYKTKKDYGQQIITVPPELDKILNQYILNHKLKLGDYLFHLGRDKKKLIKQSNFSKKIGDVFKKVYGKRKTSRLIRNSKTSNIQVHLYEEREILAKDMGHSVNQQLKYSKHKSK